MGERFPAVNLDSCLITYKVFYYTSLEFEDCKALVGNYRRIL
jgi:hypothetical protein